MDQSGLIRLISGLIRPVREIPSRRHNVHYGAKNILYRLLQYQRYFLIKAHSQADSAVPMRY